MTSVDINTQWTAVYVWSLAATKMTTVDEGDGGWNQRRTGCNQRDTVVPDRASIDKRAQPAWSQCRVTCSDREDRCIIVSCYCHYIYIIVSYYCYYMYHCIILLLLLLLLDRIALVEQRPIVVKLSREWSVGRSVCSVQCRKTADRIQMSFGTVGRMGPGKRQAVGLAIGPREGVLLRANLRSAIVFNGDFTVYICDSAAMWPSSQITLGKLITTRKCGW